MWNISQHKIGCPWPPTAPTGWQIHNTLAEPTTATEIPAALSLLTHCRLNGLTAKFSSMYWETIQVLRVTQFVPGAFEHTGTMGTPFLALLQTYQGLTRGLLWTWISSIWHKNIRWNSDTAAFNKNTFRYFCFMYTPNVWTFWTLLYSYVQVRYQCFHD